MRVLNAMQTFAKENDTAILTGIAIAGVVSTGIFAGNASIKAEHVLQDIRKNHPGKIETMDTKERVKLLAPIFMPTILCGMVTIGCIWATHSIDASKQMALMSAYSFSEKAIKSMEDKLGEKKARQLQNSIFEDDVKTNPPKESTMYDTGKGTTKFRDGILGGDFTADIEYVKSVFNKYNKMLNDGDIVYVNDIRWDLGLPQTEMGGILGWDCGQLEERLESIILERDLQDVREEDVDNIFVIVYNRPYVLHHGY